MQKGYDPLAGSAPPEIPLKRAPLVRVIAQVRFPVVIGIEKPESVAPFQEDLRQAYPVLREEQVRRIVLDGAGQRDGPSSRVWRFLDRAGAWRVSLGSDFLALETAAYKSRQDFLTRFAMLLESLVRHFQPAAVDRLGIRYIDRVIGEPVERLARFLRPEIVGILGTPLGLRSPLAISEALFSPIEDGRLRARWGLLPPNTTPDPAAIELLAEPTWFLDLDMFSDSHGEFDAELLSKSTAEFAQRIYAFFRWAVTDEFLAHFGGEP